METRGIVVGCDKNQQWMLPWWWQHYSAHNHYPVAFVDFGMTEGAFNWCQTKGQCITLPEYSYAENMVSEEHQALWVHLMGDIIWTSRPSWFKKPLALAHSPFDQTVWLDLDCQVHGSLEPLFNCLGLGVEIALVREPDQCQRIEWEKGLLLDNEISYNSGVIALQKNAAILQKWKTLSLEQSHLFVGDQHALSRAIFLEQPPLFELPAIFNWKASHGRNPEAVITHFVAYAGKFEIFSMIKQMQD
jgi:hypothetical protein